MRARRASTTSASAAATFVLDAELSRPGNRLLGHQREAGHRLHAEREGRPVVLVREREHRVGQRTGRGDALARGGDLGPGRGQGGALLQRLGDEGVDALRGCRARRRRGSAPAGRATRARSEEHREAPGEGTVGTGTWLTSGRRSSGRPRRDGREHGLPRSQFRKVSRSACVGADRARGTVRASADVRARPRRNGHPPLQRGAPGGHTVDRGEDRRRDGRRRRDGAAAAAALRRSGPSGEPSLQQQAAPSSAHDVADPGGRAGRPERHGHRQDDGDEARGRNTTRAQRAQSRPKSVLSRPDSRPVRRSRQPGRRPDARQPPSNGRKSFQKWYLTPNVTLAKLDVRPPALPMNRP